MKSWCNLFEQMNKDSKAAQVGFYPAAHISTPKNNLLNTALCDTEY